MKLFLKICLATVALHAAALLMAQSIQPDARQLLDAANHARAQAGAGTLTWDPALAEAAHQHCLHMAEEGPISHQYSDEPNLTLRTAQAGAHFSLVEENVALGDSPARIHQMWMNSPGHRENLLNPRVDRVGISVVYARGQLYAVADYARGVEILGNQQVETRVAALLAPYGLAIRANNHAAREYCGNDEHIHGPNPPHFLMRWTASGLTALPNQLTDRLSTGHYHEAEIGSCQPRNSQGFTAYQLAVLLY